MVLIKKLLIIFLSFVTINVPPLLFAQYIHFLAVYFDSQKHGHMAIPLYETACHLNVNSKNVDSCKRAGYHILELKHDPKKASIYLEKSCKKNNGDACGLLVGTYASTGEKEKALNMISFTSRFHDMTGDMYWNFGCGLYDIGFKDKMIYFLKKSGACDENISHNTCFNGKTDHYCRIAAATDIDDLKKYQPCSFLRRILYSGTATCTVYSSSGKPILKTGEWRRGTPVKKMEGE